MVKIFVSGYPLEMDELELAQLVSPHGEISTVKIVRDKATRKPKGYVFIELVSRQAAERVMEALDGTEMQGKTLTVRIREEEPVRPVPVSKRVERSPDPIKKKRPRRTL